HPAPHSFPTRRSSDLTPQLSMNLLGAPASRSLLETSKVLQFPRAVADALGRNAHAFEHREIQVRHRRLAIVTNMAAGLQPAAARSEEHTSELQSRVDL